MVAGIGVPELSELSQLKVCRQSSVMQVDEEGIGAYLYSIPPKGLAQLEIPTAGGGSIVSFLEVVFCQTVRNYQSCRVSLSKFR